MQSKLAPARPKSSLTYKDADESANTTLTNVDLDNMVVFGATTIPKTDIANTTWAFNALVRCPGNHIQPYGGIGVGLNFARLSRSTVANELNIEPTLNLLAGVRAFLTNRVALFIEYKHNRGTLGFSDNDFKGNYRTSFLLGGISHYWN